MSSLLIDVLEKPIHKIFDESDRLLACYALLSPLQQAILQIRALTFYTRRKSDFTHCIEKSDLVDEKNRKLYYKFLNPILDGLVKEKLLLPDFNCNPIILHSITEIALMDTNPRAHANKLALSFLSLDHNEAELQQIHLAVHADDVTFLLNGIANTIHNYDALFHHLIKIFYSIPLRIDWVKKKHFLIQALLCHVKLMAYSMATNSIPTDLSSWLPFYVDSFENYAFLSTLDETPVLKQKLFQFKLVMGRINLLKTQMNHLSTHPWCEQENRGSFAFFEGQSEIALAHFEKASKSFKEYFHEDSWLAGNTHALLSILLHLSQEQYDKVSASIRKLIKLEVSPILTDVLATLLLIKLGNKVLADQKFAEVSQKMNDFSNGMPLMHALVDWMRFLLDPTSVNEPSLIKKYLIKLKAYQLLHHHLAAQLYAELLLANDANCEIALAFFHQPMFGPFRFLSFLTVKEPWQFALDQLQQIFLTDSASTKAAHTQKQSKRLAWFVNPTHLSIHIAEQKIQKNGTWSNGRPIALKRLYQKVEPGIDYLSEQDRHAIQGLRREVSGWYHEEHYYWDNQITIKALIGHPMVFHSENPTCPIELVHGEVALQIEHKNEGYHLSLHPYSEVSKVILEQETANRYRVIDFSQDAVNISKILSSKGLTVPPSAKNAVVSIVTQDKHDIRIYSDLADDTLPTISGNTTCCVHLLPLNNGLKINLWIRPFETEGSYCRAGVGQAMIIASCKQDGESVRKKAIRDFDAEKQSVQSLIAACQTLAAFDHNTHEWLFDSVETCLEVLTELENYKKTYPVHIEWPKGQTIKLKQVVDAKNLSLSIKGKDYWFEYDGEIRLDENQTLNMKNLLDLLEQDHGRFIQLADGEFIALTTHFKKQLEELKAIADGNKIYHLSSSVLRVLSNEAGHIKVNQQWKQHIEKLKSMEKHQPSIPSTLQATLREYQEEGFTYLSKLTHWEIGVCLADDMGLGKTVQAIALLLEQASNGPCLVVAPTSVCFIWIEELTKFAPTLTPFTLHNGNSIDRTTLIQSLGPMDILICSYGLLHQAGEALCNRDWQLIILDEAQAIKNSETKRWQYATQLKSKRRVALTGTPIENHLGEIWSIFRFLNPGLLGSKDFFQKRYAQPIEKDRDPIAKRTLKNLVQPYILRRTKSEVLKELPSKTEQSILIEPSTDEMAFYEAVRIKALERIEQLNNSNEGSKRFGILAEITRLRQACCHASLVDPQIDLPSSKIETFLTLVKNLLDNHHKVLVFSQFVRYLNIVKELFDKEHIHYQYLDGSSKPEDRKKSVNDFQEGLGDVFLISLKAGGVGLNLTAADYVVILDPWWNPAVEDQAADRAHRFGQERPVTIYRLIMKNSIEEKIIKLHHDKRDLATDLLSGGDIAGKISDNELLQLIQP